MDSATDWATEKGDGGRAGPTTTHPTATAGYLPNLKTHMYTGATIAGISTATTTIHILTIRGANSHALDSTTTAPTTTDTITATTDMAERRWWRWAGAGSGAWDGAPG